MAVHQPAWLDEGNRRQCSGLDVGVEIGRVLDVRRRTFAGLAMMDVSYWNGLQMLQYSSVFAPDRPVVELVGVRDVVVPLVAVILPRNIGGDHGIANAPYRRRWNRKHGVVRVRVYERIAPLPKYPGL